MFFFKAHQFEEKTKKKKKMNSVDEENCNHQFDLSGNSLERSCIFCGKVQTDGSLVDGRVVTEAGLKKKNNSLLLSLFIIMFIEKNSLVYFFNDMKR